MSLQYFCPRWGSEHIDWADFFIRCKDAGFDGVEYAISSATPTRELDIVWDLAAKNNILMLAQHYDTNESDFERHIEQYSQWLNRISRYPVLSINSQTGKDFFSFEQNLRLIDQAMDLAARTGIPISHETHRGKFSYSAHMTKQYLYWFSELRLTLDLSHWVNVSESYLQDQQTTVIEAMERTDHLHARVGFPEGPQVPDPRLPEWREALNYHLNWWDHVVSLQPHISITPEFGPYPYNVSGTDQWEVNVWMMNFLKKRYA
ncbi:Xylose isomerase-like TIM barrel [Mucilaginibacter pineti]|uniref:Xylose isomerase-like TIM barrel n=1 Tax=Mucilaginibacter pineti TaxID=1391627 RepID=A0A1G7GAM8_9SPHI|nr:TIM barrel protein [Mucilaginibacter pineti]SDE85186.1 Xylose isomerase-like TIM barrel [Mucilaginibacter pineti]